MKGNNFKAGIFVLFALAIMIYMILRVSQGGLFFSSTYPIYLEVASAAGLAQNTPVQIAGVDIGLVDGITLTSSNKARLRLAIRNDVVISRSSRGYIKTTGILGDAFIEIVPGDISSPPMKKDDVMTDVTTFGDINSLTGQMSLIAEDVKAITGQMRKLMAGDDSSFDRTMRNIEKITNTLANVSTKNEGNIDAIIANLKILSQNLNAMVAQNMGNVNGTLNNIDDITGTIAAGKGTIGKLVKDEETINKINDSLDSLNNFLGGANRLKVDLGMHSEYLAGTGDFKNYVELKLKPRPDKFFLFEAVSDPDPSFNSAIEENIITSGGTTSTITTKTRSKRLNGFLFSAQIAKKIRDFTIRGGLIESSGGVGFDYDRGPIGFSFQAFDFKSDEGQKPHLKAMARAQLTNSFYLLGGVDDIINPNQDLAWFLGAGFTFTDDDLKSLLGIFATSAR